jgi:hypothetical protein
VLDLLLAGAAPTSPFPWDLPEGLKALIDYLTRPEIFISGTTILFFLSCKFYRQWTKPKVAMGILVGSIVFLFASMGDGDFWKIISKPDNVPIAGMLYLVGFFWWWAFRQAALNDERIEAGEPPNEALESRDRILVWPDLVYIELIALVVCTIVLILWSIPLKAPLEEYANISWAPNPAKAPWYFLGLQEMLVYFDPWLAGVVFPSMIIVGLMAIPYIDTNPKGMGYYTLKERSFAITTWMFGFIILWVALIILGTFLRGPNWNFFGPYEYWDPHKLEELTNVNLSEYVWVRWGGVPMPENILIRELPGILLCGGYFAVMPLLLAVTVFRKMFTQIGFVRFSVMIGLFLFMWSLPIKMVLRWTMNMKYLIAIPEYFFNI